MAPRRRRGHGERLAQRVVGRALQAEDLAEPQSGVGLDVDERVGVGELLLGHRQEVLDLVGLNREQGVIVPRRNEKDLPDIPEEVKSTLVFHFVETVDDVLAIAETGDGAVWFGTMDGGLVRLHDGRITVMTETNGLPSSNVPVPFTRAAARPIAAQSAAPRYICSSVRPWREITAGLSCNKCSTHGSTVTVS